jgi:superfamily II DNA or RNA helicase
LKNTKIKIKGSTAEIFGEYNTASLNRALTFKSPGYWFSPAYKSGAWDGKVKFLKNNKFPVGFLQRAKIVLSKDVEIQYLGDYPKINLTSLTEYLEKANLRDYQIDAVKCGIKNRLGIINLAANAGKSRCIAGIISAFPQSQFLILAHRIDILSELQETFDEFLVNQNYELSTFQSAKKYDLTQFDGVLVDEVQTVAANTFYKIVNSCINANIRLGFSATPKRSDGKDYYIEATVGKPIIKVKQSELIERGISTKPKIYLIPYKVDFIDNVSYSKAEDMLINDKTRNQMIADLCKDRHEVMILFRRIDHGKLLHNLIPGSVYIDGNDNKSKRDKTKKDFKEGKIKVLLSSNIFDTGINLNNIKTLILAWAGKSPFGLTQKIGRALRNCKGKDSVDVFCFAEVGNKYFEQHTNIRIDELIKEGYDVKTYKL